MSPKDAAKLVFLASIWGCSFIFLRIIVPELGAIMTALLRVTLSSLALLVFAKAIRIDMNWRFNFKAYAAVGMFATVVPFTCFSLASQYLPAAYSALLNATSPLFGALFSVLWLHEPMGLRKSIGLLTGVAGVAVLVGAGALDLTAATVAAALACLAAAASYAVSTIIVKKTAHAPHGQQDHIPPLAMAIGSMVAGAAIMLPTLPFVIPQHWPSTPALAAIFGLSMLSSGLAQVMFIPLIVRIGPTRAMSVAFLIPPFGMLWAWLFLDEAVASSTVVGGLIVLVAMGLVLSASRPKPEDALTAEA